MMYTHNCPECGRPYSTQENVSRVKCPYCGAVNDTASCEPKQDQSKHRFILNRTRDWATEPKKKIVIRTVVWFFALIIVSRLLLIACISVYMANGIDPTQLTEFGGSTTHWLGKPLLNTLLMLLVIAPIAEEIIFRLGLSFKRHMVGLWVGLLPVVTVAYLFKCNNWMILTALALAGIALYYLIIRYTTDEQWERWRSRYLRPAMWVSAITFGLIHLIAFTNYSWLLAPYMIAVILSPMLLGCVITYARVNLNFWCGVLVHFINNLPVAFILLAMH